MLAAVLMLVRAPSIAAWLGKPVGWRVLWESFQGHGTVGNAIYEGYNAGMGLGLSFTAVVLEHHGARLEVDTEPLKGTTFRVVFPLAHE